jgi:phage gp29-like protein
MPVTDQIISAARAAARRAALRALQVAGRLHAFSTGQPPTLPGVGLPATPYPLTDARMEARTAGQDALEAFLAARAGPLPTRISSDLASNLDPTRIKRIFDSADQGISIYQYGDFTKRLRERDSHLCGIDRQRRQSVANKPFLIWPRLDTDRLCVGLAHFMRAVVDDIDGFPAAVYSLLSKNCDGWSLNEIVWVPGRVRFQMPDGNGGGPMIDLRGMFPRSIEWVHAKHAAFKQDTFEPLLDLGTSKIHLPSHKFIYSLAAGEGLAPARGYSRSVAWMHFFKHATLRDWNVFLHIYGIPLLHGSVPFGKWRDKAIRDALDIALEAFGRDDQRPVLPDDAKIEITNPTSMSGATDAWFRMAGFCNAEQSKAVLGETLTTEAGESGSYKLGDVHQDSAHEVVVGDALTTASDLRADLFLSILELNADALAQVFNVRPEELPLANPLCAFRTDREWTPEVRLASFAKGTEIGIDISESQVRREMQFDKPTSPSDRVKGKPIVVAKGGAAVGSVAAADGVKNPDEDANATAPGNPTTAPAVEQPQQPPPRGAE